MSASEMTYMSYFFAITAVVFGTASAAMFFVYDIRRCWQIVSGKQVRLSFVKAFGDRKKNHITTPAQHDGSQKTELLYPNIREDTCKSTLLLAAEETEPLETMCLIQDITVMEIEQQH